MADAASICHSSNLFRNVFVTHDSPPPPPIRKRIWAVADAASICHSSNLFRNVFFITVTVITTCHSSNLLRNVFFTTHWPTGILVVTLCHAVPSAVPLKLGRAAAAAFLNWSMNPFHRTRRFSQPPATSKKYRTASAWIRICRLAHHPTFAAWHNWPLALALARGGGGEPSARRWWTEHTEMVLGVLWPPTLRPLPGSTTSISGPSDGSRPHSKWAPALVSLQQEALLQKEDLQDDAPKSAKSVVQDHPSPKKAHFPIDQLDNYHALRSGQSVPRCRSSDAYCMHPQAQSVAAAGQAPSSQCWLQWSREVGQ